MSDLEQDEKDKRYEKGDEGSCVDGDDVFAVLLAEKGEGGELERRRLNRRDWLTGYANLWTEYQVDVSSPTPISK